MVGAGEGPRARGYARYGARRGSQRGTGRRGIVHLVGAGPGDPELLTLRALRLLQQADVIVYDNLVGEGILELARRDARTHLRRQALDRHSLRAGGNQQAARRLASAGKRVVRLKGGDPFLFGRGGEELEALRRARRSPSRSCRASPPRTAARPALASPSPTAITRRRACSRPDISRTARSTSTGRRSPGRARPS